MSDERAKACLESAREALEHGEAWRVPEILRELRSAASTWIRAEMLCLEGDAAFALGNGALALSRYAAGLTETASPEARPALHGKVASRLAYTQAAFGDPGAAEVTYRAALSKLVRAPESAEVLVAMASAANGLAFVLANAKDKQQESKALAARVMQHSERALELLAESPPASRRKAEILRGRAHMARAFALWDTHEKERGVGELSMAAVALATIQRAEARLELRSVRETRARWEAQLAHSASGVPLACDFCGRTEDAVTFLFPSHDAKTHLCGPCAIAASHGTGAEPAPCAICGGSYYRIAVASGQRAACEACVAGFVALHAGTFRDEKDCLRCGNSDAPGLPDHGPSLCDECVAWAVAEVERSSPRMSGRERMGPVTHHHGRRCATCGLHGARAFVRVSSVAEEPIDVCDGCIDAIEATTIERSAGVTRATSTGAVEVPDPDTSAVELLRKRVRWIEAALESGRPELLAQLAMARTWLAEELYDEGEMAESTRALEDALSLLDHSTDSEMFLARFRVARLRAIKNPENVEASALAREAANEADRRGDLADPERTFSWLAQLSRKTDAPRMCRRDLEKLLSIAARHPRSVSAQNIGRVLRLIGDCHFYLKTEERARVAYETALSILGEGPDAALFAAPAWLGLGNVRRDPAESEQAYEKARALFLPYAEERYGTALDLVTTLQALASRRERRQAWAAAATTFDELFDVATRANEQFGQLAVNAARALGDSARCHERSGNHERALENASRALRLLDRNDPKRTEISTLRRTLIARRDGIDLESVCQFCDVPPSEDAAVVIHYEAAVCGECVVAFATEVDDDRDSGELDEAHEYEDSPCGFCTTQRARAMLDGIGTRLCDHCAAIGRDLVNAPHDPIAAGSPPRKLRREAMSCSFCEKSQREVKKLIANNRFYICDECIGLANDIVFEQYGDDRAAREALPKTPCSVTCRFCDLSSARTMIAGPNVAICDACVDLCNDIILGETENSA